MYIGVLGPHRGLSEAVEAMPEILKTITNARLVLVGSGNSEAHLKKLVSDNQLSQSVEFTGRQPFYLVPSYIAASKICLHTYADTLSPQSRAGSPTKLFQYMAMGKPTIVASSLESAKQLILRENAGSVYTAGDTHSLAQAVIKLYQDSAMADEMGQNGQEAVRKYDWMAEGRKLVDLYEQLRR